MKTQELKRFSVIEIKFVPNKKEGQEPISHTESGKMIFIHAGHKGKVCAGQVWACKVVTIRDNFIVVVPDTLLVSASGQMTMAAIPTKQKTVKEKIIKVFPFLSKNQIRKGSEV